MSRYIVEIGGMYAATMDPAAPIEAGATFAVFQLDAMKWSTRSAAQVQALAMSEAHKGSIVTVRDADTMAKTFEVMSF